MTKAMMKSESIHLLMVTWRAVLSEFRESTPSHQEIQPPTTASSSGPPNRILAHHS